MGDCSNDESACNVMNNPVGVYLANLPNKGSQRTMRQGLDTVAHLMGVPDATAFDWLQLRCHHLVVVRAKLMDRYAPATVNGCLSAIRGVAKAAWRPGLISADELQRLRGVKGIPNHVEPAGRHVTKDEFRTLIAVCEADPSAVGVRDTAMIALLYTCGLRRAELVGLRLRDHTPEEKILLVQGKGRQQRLPSPTPGR